MPSGTWIVDERDAQRLGAPCWEATFTKDEADHHPRRCRPAGVVHAVFLIAAAEIVVHDAVVENGDAAGTTEEVGASSVGKVLPEALHRDQATTAREIGATSVTHDAEVAKVSVVGLGMRTHTGVAAAADPRGSRN